MNERGTKVLALMPLDLDGRGLAERQASAAALRDRCGLQGLGLRPQEI